MTNEDTPLPIGLGGSDADGDPLAFSIIRRPANGSAGVPTQTSPTGAESTYTPKENYAGPDSLVFQVDDGRGGTATATVGITVKPVDDPPNAKDDTITTRRNQPATRNVLANDSDPDGDPLTITAVTQGSNGSVTTDGQTVTYTPDDDFTGSDSFTYTISDGNLTDTATVNVRVRERPPRAELSMNKTVTSAEFKAGQQATYTLTVLNSGGADATNVTVTDTIPALLTLVSATPSQGSPCTGNPAVTCNLGTIPGGQSAAVTIVVNIPSSATGVVSNSAVVSSPDDNVQSDRDTVMTTISAMADLSIDKAVTSAEFEAGQQATYTITVVNNGPADATGVTVNDTIPAPLSLVSATPSQGSPCAGNPAVTCALGTIAAGGNATVTIVVDIPASATGTISNTATVSSPDDTMTGNNSDTDMTLIGALADLVINKTGPAAAVAGNNITYTVTVTNNGPADAPGVTVADTLPSGVTFVSTTGCTPDPGNPVCSLGTVTAGGSAQYTIEVTIDPSTTGLITNSATVSSSATEANPGDETATADTIVSSQADLVITKSDSPDPVVAGNQLTYTVTVTNNGPSDARDVAVTDTLPAGVSSPMTSGCAEDSGGTPICTLGTIAANTSAMYTITVAVDPNTTGMLTNSASVASSTTLVNTGDDSVMQITTVNQEADLQMEKTPATSNVTAGGQVVYTLKVTNNGPSDASGVSVVDTFPADLTHSINTCGSTPAGNMFTWNVGALADGAMATCTVTFNVGAAATANIENSVTVTGAETDPNSSNDTFQTDNPVAFDVTLSVTKTVDPTTPFQQGTIADYLVTVSHIAGTSNANNVQATDVLDSRLTFVPAGSSGGCSEIGQTVSCNGGSIPPGGMIIFRIRVMIGN